MLCFLRIDEKLSFRKVADRFHQMFPNRPKPSDVGIAKMVAKLRATGSVADVAKSGRPRTATNEANEVMALGSVELNYRQSLREVASETTNSLSSVWRILKRHKFHPYGVKSETGSAVVGTRFYATGRFLRDNGEADAGSELHETYLL